MAISFMIIGTNASMLAHLSFGVTSGVSFKIKVFRRVIFFDLIMAVAIWGNEIKSSFGKEAIAIFLLSIGFVHTLAVFHCHFSFSDFSDYLDLA